jgi:hypothetical protein
MNMEPSQPSESPQPSGAEPASKGKRRRASSDAGQTPSAKEAEGMRREEKIAPLVAELQAADFDGYKSAVDKTVAAARRQQLGKKCIQSLLQHALRHAPPTLNGACIVRHFKGSSDWNPDEVVSAAHAVASVVRERIEEIVHLGPLLHGALIPLIDAVTKRRGPVSDSKPTDDVVAALLALHSAAWSMDRPALRGLPDTDEGKFFGGFVAWLDELSERPDVRAIEGQHLFGFGVVMRLRSPRGVERRDIAPESAQPGLDREPIAEPTAVVRPDQNEQAPPPKQSLQPRGNVGSVDSAEQARFRKALEGLERKVADLEERLERSESARARLRSDRDVAVRESAEASTQILAITKQLERSLVRGDDLETRLAQMQSIEAELATAREALALERKQSIEVREQLTAADAAIEAAKQNEFGRGLRAGKAAAARQCVEPLEQIESAAQLLPEQSGMFIREMSKSLISYFGKGEANV